MTTRTSARITIDARDAFCPGPMMKLISALKQTAIGDEVEVLSRDKGTSDDVPAWTRSVDTSWSRPKSVRDCWSFVVKKMK